MNDEKNTEESSPSEESSEDSVLIFIFGLLLGIGGTIVFFVWFKDYEIPPSFLSNLLYWLALAAVSFGVALLIQEEFEAAPNTDVSKALKIAIILGLVLTASFFGGAETINSVSFSTTQLALATSLSFLVGLTVWKVRSVSIYGQFFYVILLTSGIGLTWFARLSGSSQGQVIAAGFLVGALFHFGNSYIKKGAASVT